MEARKMADQKRLTCQQHKLKERNVANNDEKTISTGLRMIFVLILGCPKIEFWVANSTITWQPQRINENPLTSDRQKTYVPWFLRRYHIVMQEY